MPPSSKKDSMKYQIREQRQLLRSKREDDGREEILNKLAAEEQERRAEQEYIENLRIQLYQEEAEEREREKERIERERREQ